MDMFSNQAQPGQPVSPLTLSHTLLTLAEDADRAGMARSAVRLLRLAQFVCAERPASLPFTSEV